MSVAFRSCDFIGIVDPKKHQKTLSNFYVLWKVMDCSKLSLLLTIAMLYTINSEIIKRILLMRINIGT